MKSNQVLANQITWPETLYNSCIHLSMFVFVFCITKLSFSNGLSLFAWHPPLMLFGFLILMGEAILCFNNKNIITQNMSHKEKVRLHWILQFVAAGSICLGFLAIYINKYLNDKPHGETYHSSFGLTSIITVGLTMIGGTAAMYSVQLKHLVRPAIIKIIHSIAGIFNFTLAIITMILALYSHWFTRNGSNLSFYLSWIAIIFIAQYIVLHPLWHVLQRVQKIKR